MLVTPAFPLVSTARAGLGVWMGPGLVEEVVRCVRLMFFFSSYFFCSRCGWRMYAVCSPPFQFISIFSRRTNGGERDGQRRLGKHYEWWYRWRRSGNRPLARPLAQGKPLGIDIAPPKRLQRDCGRVFAWLPLLPLVHRSYPPLKSISPPKNGGGGRRG